jgi:hypothetical protein
MQEPHRARRFLEQHSDPLRSAYRDGNTADARLDNLGVRVARTLDVP